MDKLRREGLADVWMRSLEEEKLEKPLPDPDLIWIKARIAERQSDDERAHRLLSVMSASSTVLILAAVAVIAVNWSTIRGFVFARLTAMPWANQLPQPTLEGVAAVLTGLALAMTLHICAKHIRV